MESLRSTLFGKATKRLNFRVPAQAPAVYVVWGEEREYPLYIGRTEYLLGRLGEHTRRSHFADEVVRFECYLFATEDDAQDAEAHAIRAMRPAYNGNFPMTIEERDEARQWYRDRITYNEADRERVRRLVEEYKETA